MDERFLVVNSAVTHLMTFGQDKLDEGVKEMVLVITGNPGLPGFYTSFSSTLYEELDKQIPVCIVGHAGHDEPKESLNMITPPLHSNKDLYNLQGQIRHKVEFIKNHIPEDVKIHLISHSIGSKISLELLKNDEISDRIHQGYLLFPTIERMVDSHNGFWFYKVFNRIFFLLRFFYYAFSYLPLTLRTIILYIYCYFSGFPEFFLGTIIKASTPQVLDKIWFMAQDEMETVCDIDEEVIKRNMHRLKFYYGTTDGWVPVKYYKELTEKFPGIDAELCERSIDHGFVISHGPTMARMVSDWINRKRVSKSTY